MIKLTNLEQLEAELFVAKLTQLEQLQKAVVDTKAAFEAAAYDYYDYDAADAWDDAEDAVPAAWTDYRKALQELEDYLKEQDK